jgi:hypothetical protein
MSGEGASYSIVQHFPLLRASHGRALEPCAYSANNKVGGNYYAHQKKICDRRN